ncbi:unnamed protein product, partial [Prorocentrum cordatum]
MSSPSRPALGPPTSVHHPAVDGVHGGPPGSAAPAGSDLVRRQLWRDDVPRGWAWAPAAAPALPQRQWQQPAAFGTASPRGIGAPAGQGARTWTPTRRDGSVFILQPQPR